MFKLDLHIHTEYSNDCRNSILEILKVVEKLDIKAIAITDHDTDKGVQRILRENPIYNVTIVPGIEFSTRYGHVLGLFISQMPQRALSLEELIDYIHEEGGLVIIAHPFDIFRRFTKLKHFLPMIDGLEVANASDLRLKRNMSRLMEICEMNNKCYTAGSDAHVIEAVGKTYMYSDEYLENIDDIFEYIVKKRFKIYADRTSLYLRLKKFFV